MNALLLWLLAVGAPVNYDGTTDRWTHETPVVSVTIGCADNEDEPLHSCPEMVVPWNGRS